MLSSVAAPTVQFGSAELYAPPNWRMVDFISDLHLEPGQPVTWAAWRDYLLTTPADAVFLLGDIFEVWIGDDAAAPGSFEAECAAVLAQAAEQRALYFIPGNRDFLVGSQFLALSHTQALPDPCVLCFTGQRWLLSHGDALCLADTDYQVFREQVRSPAWQNRFLAMPLTERRAIARQLREQSSARHRRSQPGDDADADPMMTAQWLHQHHAHTLIHGHTHRPAEHLITLGDTSSLRYVLSDWDALAQPPRLQLLRGTAQGLQRLNLPCPRLPLGRRFGPTLWRITPFYTA